MQDGPILLGMRIYQDFYAYESGRAKFALLGSHFFFFLKFGA